MPNRIRTPVLQDSEETQNGLTGSAKSYANVTAVGALVVFMVMTASVVSYVVVALVDSHRELTKAFHEVAVEIRVLGERNSRDANDFRKEMREQAAETHALIRAMLPKKDQ